MSKKYPPTELPHKDATGERPACTSVMQEASRPIKKESSNEEKTTCGTTRHEQPLSNQTDPTVGTPLQESESIPTFLAAMGFEEEYINDITHRMQFDMINAEGNTEEDKNTQQLYDNQIEITKTPPIEDTEEFFTQLEEDFKEDYRQMQQAFNAL